MDQHNPSRRGFIRMTASGAAAAGVTSALFGTVRRAGGARSDAPVRVGVIGAGVRSREHLKTLRAMKQDGRPVDVVALCDVFDRRREEAKAKIAEAGGPAIQVTRDYREVLDNPQVDTVAILTPDHWHARMTLDAFRAGKHVYCEKPMTHTVAEAIEVVDAWRQSGRVMQVGAQDASLPVWGKARQMIQEGKLGKVVQYQTEYFRNSSVGQWRYYPLTRDMTPETIDWKMFLGTEFGLAPDMPFDRAAFAQWRRFWPFGSGMYTDLFVHRTISMLQATGLRYPGRVVGGGGIFLEYDGRDVSDVATVVADFTEGAQGIVTATMCSEGAPLRHIIRGHHGSLVFSNSDSCDGFDFVAERPQVTLDSSVRSERYHVGGPADPTRDHWENFVAAISQNRPDAVHCPPDLGAAAVVIINLGAKSYREGKVFHFDPAAARVGPGDASWAAGWESMSRSRAEARHVPGWKAGDRGSQLVDPPYQKLEGPWTDGVDPA